MLSMRCHHEVKCRYTQSSALLMMVPERRVGVTVNGTARAIKGDESGDSKSEKCTFSFLSF